MHYGRRDSLFFQACPGHFFMRGYSLIDLTEHDNSAADIMVHSKRGQGNIHFSCSADHEQDRQPYPVDPSPAICDAHTYIAASELGRNPVSCHQIQPEYRDEQADAGRDCQTVSRNQMFRRERGQGNIHFSV